jgi:hypothetical protein
MNKLIRLHESPFHSPIETVFNLTLSLSAPTSEKEVTIIFNGNTTNYQESNKKEGLEISQIIMTEGTESAVINTFNLSDQSGFGLKIAGEFYEVRLINIGKENQQGQDFLYYEFCVKNRTDEKVRINIEKEGSANIWFDPTKHPLVFTPDNCIEVGKFDLEGNNVMIIFKGKQFGVVINPKEARMITLYETEIEENLNVKHMITITWSPRELKIYHNAELKTQFDPDNLA